jgi:hypothetical protein
MSTERLTTLPNLSCCGDHARFLGNFTAENKDRKGDGDTKKILATATG